MPEFLQIDGPEATAVENRLRRDLARVRFVFELGFPEELVNDARNVVMTAVGSRRFFSGVTVRYPACLVVTVVAAARDYDGRSFWSSEALSAIGIGDQQLAAATLEAFRQVGLDTFEEETSAENALRRLSPVLMHAGIPAPNLADLVRLVATSQRQHVFGADEQILAWSRTPHGFRGLWRAPQLFLKYGGAAAVDLLDRLNDAIAAPDPSVSGLPAHLLDVLDDLSGDDVAAIARLRRDRPPRPRVLVDPWSCDGPFVQAPRVSRELVSRWKVSAGPSCEVPVYPSSIEMQLDPQREWEIQALRGADVCGRWSVPAYAELPVLFFDGRSGVLLSPSGTRRKVQSGTVFVLVHPRVELVDVETTGNRYPELVGRWTGWKLVELVVPPSGLVHCREAGGSDATEVLHFSRDRRRPELTIDSLVPGVRCGDDVPVLSRPPHLDLWLGSVEAGQVTVEVAAPDGVVHRRTIAELGGRSPYDLAPLFTADGLYTVAVIGPLGLRLPGTSVLLSRGLVIRRSPRVATIDESVAVHLESGGGGTTMVAPPLTTELTVGLNGQMVSVDVPRVQWSLRKPDLPLVPMGSRHLQISADDLSASPLLSVSLGAHVYSTVQLRSGEQVLSEIRSPGAVDRWTVSLDRLNDTVMHASAKTLTLAITADGKLVEVGRVIATYEPTLRNVRCDPAIRPAVIEADLEENRPFRGRVVRLWNLERPWDRSIRIAVDDDQRQSLQIRMPSGHASGRYRVSLGVEHAWSLEPPMPPLGAPGSFDVRIDAGASPDLDRPEDRIVAALRPDSRVNLAAADIADHGDLLIARLAAGLRLQGMRWLTTAEAGRVVNQLEEAPEYLPQSLGSALRRGFVGAEESFDVSLALLPVLVDLERRVDLHLAADTAEEMWTLMPLAAACIESWSDSPEACERWQRYVGWPSTVFAATDGDVPRPADVQLVIDLTPLQPLPNDLRSQVRAALSNPAFAQGVHAMTGLSDRLLSADMRFRGIAEFLLDHSSEVYQRWLDQHSGAIRSALVLAASTSNENWIFSVSLGDDPNTRGALMEIAALSAAIVSRASDRPELHRALIDAVAFARTWVVHCLVQMFASDDSRHSGALSPISRKGASTPDA